MRVRIFALLMLGAVMALIAGVATFSYTRSMESELMSAQAAIQAFGTTKRVPVAIFDIPRGPPVKPEDFASILLPEEQLPSNVMEVLPSFAPEKPVFALGDLRAGALLLQTSLGSPVAGGVAELLSSPDGRAVAVLPRNLGDFRDRLAVGDLVDLFWMRDIGGGSTETRLIGNALRLLELPRTASVAGASVGGATTSGHLLLEVGLRDAARVIDAGESGSFYILPSRGPVRPGADVIEVSDEELASLPLVTRVGEAPASPRPSPTTERAPNARCSAIMVRAGNRVEVDVPC